MLNPPISYFEEVLMRVKQNFFSRGYFKMGNGANVLFWRMFG
jgi:hypothetical protein